MAETSLHTLAVHAGERAIRHAPAEAAYAEFVSVATPVYSSVSYTYAEAEALDAALGGAAGAPVYGRYGNPTVAAFEAAMAALEGGEAALAYGSGMAALYGVLLGTGARAGAGIVAAMDLYGATHGLLQRVLAAQGVTVRFVDAGDASEVEAALRTVRPAALLVETISNPLLRVADLPRLARQAHDAGAVLVVDNTFATPVLCRPLELGADYVVHSATKYIGGHGDVLGGVAVTSASRREALNEINKLVGANLGPQEAWLLLRGAKTLPLRMARQCAVALEVARWLQRAPAVERVQYPGLPSHPQHEAAAALLQGGSGGIVSFELAGAGRTEVFRFLSALRLVQPATSLGDVYSLILYPAMSSHRALDPDARHAIGIGDGLLRLSLGIEDPADIIADLDHALGAL
jgi:cystathionine gamma-synthase/methionine-gamma-lyase